MSAKFYTGDVARHFQSRMLRPTVFGKKGYKTFKLDIWSFFVLIEWWTHECRVRILSLQKTGNKKGDCSVCSGNKERTIDAKREGNLHLLKSRKLMRAVNFHAGSKQDISLCYSFQRHQMFRLTNIIYRGFPRCSTRKKKRRRKKRKSERSSAFFPPLCCWHCHRR